MHHVMQWSQTQYSTVQSLYIMLVQTAILTLSTHPAIYLHDQPNLNIIAHILLPYCHIEYVCMRFTHLHFLMLQDRYKS